MQKQQISHFSMSESCRRATLKALPSKIFQPPSTTLISLLKLKMNVRHIVKLCDEPLTAVMIS